MEISMSLSEFKHHVTSLTLHFHDLYPPQPPDESIRRDQTTNTAILGRFSTAASSIAADWRIEGVIQTTAAKGSYKHRGRF